MDSAILRINLYPLDSTTGSPNIYLVEIAIQLLKNWGQECSIVKFKNLEVKLRVFKPDNTRQGKAKQDKTRQDWHDTMALKSLT